MAIKYISIPETKTTVAILHHTEWSAIDKINNILAGTKTLFFDPERYKMKRSYKATVVCRDGDEYSEERGREEAAKKLMANYYKALDKRIDMFEADLNEAMFRVTIKCPKKFEKED
jgi:hypothetical protein